MEGSLGGFNVEGSLGGPLWKVAWGFTVVGSLGAGQLQREG